MRFMPCFNLDIPWLAVVEVGDIPHAAGASDRSGGFSGTSRIAGGSKEPVCLMPGTGVSSLYAGGSMRIANE